MKRTKEFNDVIWKARKASIREKRTVFIVWGLFRTRFHDYHVSVPDVPVYMLRAGKLYDVTVRRNETGALRSTYFWVY